MLTYKKEEKVCFYNIIVKLKNKIKYLTESKNFGASIKSVLKPKKWV